ncbi:MAG TPA: hypothetical protein PLR06_03525 [Cyclobacteriaceae bacterium]|nr:hypothetical protein [Cyclobacteriaceae bacterium]
MKRWIQKMAIVLTAGLTLTCSQSPDIIVFTGPDFVFFDSKAIVSMYENQTTPLTIPIKVSQVQGAITNVTFEVIGSNVLAGSDYIVQTGSPVQILPNKFGSSISILPVNNAIIQPETRTITIRIKSIDNPNLTPQVIKEVVINLLDDDCLPTVPKVSLWTGSVNIAGGSSSATGTAEAGAGGICGGTLVVTGKFFGDANPSSTMTIIMTQGTLVPTKGFTSVIRFPLFTGSTYEYEASGTYDETSKTISLNFTVTDTSDNTFNFTGTHTITPK